MKKKIIEQELNFKAVRSGGAGGQHVNKVSSKVVLSWDCQKSVGITEEEKVLLLERLKNRINKDGILILETDTTRSQVKNKELVINKLFDLIAKSLKVDKVRKETKVPKSVINKRKETKVKMSLKKALRKRVL
ncbi:alternative ribosome rescue aminoacyl-tRNA hydrolase ArfB [Myroides pelagicus]|uniref:alternative ribosome rescue aminoacyl-tRNA hydrolase ArfB n=1 Tax=Myroides pelagicus TaxID=270914 RepID=UPI002DB6E0D6|nr:alternative ribosome rescue aminoacyl-tRNA hydrolase ArfB [Myroides pelagicus]MEC4112617.1 alternative ribosome rescue aminoacyl-tRNA hydrolase ArfB [Myroides pelagicus]